MTKQKQNANEKYRFPSEEEIEQAQRICCGRICNACETPAAYAFRKREVDMSVLLERAVRLELTEVEREAITLHWYDNESVTSIAEKKKISPAAVTKTLNRAKEKLERVLIYAVLYQQDITDESIIPVIIGRARVIAAARNTVGGTIGDRIMRLRQSQCLNLKTLGDATGISVSRLKKIEYGTDPTVKEVIALSEFFEVTADFILKGLTDEQRKNIA